MQTMKNILLALTLMLGTTYGLYAQCPANGSGGAFINEVANISGEPEYVELVVVGDPANPTANVNLSGYILDDNNLSSSGQGTANGHLILGSCLAAVPPGSIILIYDGMTPPTGAPANDPTDANMDGVYVIGSSDPCIDGCTSAPCNGSGCPTATSSYTCAGALVGGGNASWTYVSMSNGGDVMQLIDPSENLVHGVYWVDAANYPNSGSGSAVDIGSDGNAAFGCGDWNDAATLLTDAATPGAANDADNQILIDNIAAGTACETDGSGALTAGACVAAPPACEAEIITFPANPTGN